MKGTVYITAIAALIGTPALAADIAVKAPPPAPPPAPVFSWTGCYLGGHVGGAWISKEFNGPFNFTLGALPPVPLTDNNLNENGSGGFLGGVQAGCNYQYSPNWVVGIDGDASWTDTTASSVQKEFLVATGTLPSTFVNENSSGTLSAKTDFIATLTGRLGYTRDRTMIYAKGGAAWAHDKYDFNGQTTNSVCTAILCTSVTPPFTSVFDFNTSETRVGWTVGGGLEWAFWDNWSAKLEYDFLDFGTRNVTFAGTGTSASVAAAFGQQTIGVRQRISEVKLGLNYLFNYGLH
jgi:outer membrane immunogenic protein